VRLKIDEINDPELNSMSKYETISRRQDAEKLSFQPKDISDDSADFELDAV